MTLLSNSVTTHKTRRCRQIWHNIRLPIQCRRLFTCICNTYCIKYSQYKSSHQQSRYKQPKKYFTTAEPYKVHHTTKRTVPYTIQQIHNVIIDVNQYHTFLPYCTSATVDTTEPIDTDTMKLMCTVNIQFMMLSEKYRSIVTYKPDDLSHIRINAIQSRMFEQLESNWYLHANPDNTNNTDITLISDVVVSSPLHAQIARLFFDTVTKRQIDAFTTQLNKLHGNTIRTQSIQSKAESARAIIEQRKRDRSNTTSTNTRTYSTLRRHTAHNTIHKRTLFGMSMSPSQPITHNIRQIIDFPSEQLFNVVLDVDKYYEFLPFCVYSKITRTINDHSFEADMSIGFRMFTESYKSLITYNRPNDISVQAIQSQLFDHLVSRWSFKPMHDNKTRTIVTFTIDFEVSSPIHAAAVNMFFAEIAQRQMNAFTDRCKQLFQHENAKLQPVTSNQAVDTSTTDIQTKAGKAAPTLHSVGDQPRLAEATQSLKPTQSVVATQNNDYIGHTCKPWWHGPAGFTGGDIYKLRTLFVKYATMNHHINGTNTHNTNQEAAEIDSVTGAELCITLQQWQSIADMLYHADHSHTTLLTRFRDRAVLLAASTDIHIARALYYHNPFYYPRYIVPDTDVDLTFTNSDGEITYEHMHVHTDNEQHHSIVPQDETKPSMGFSEFVQQIYYLTKAKYEDKLRYTLYTSCITLISQNSEWGTLQCDTHNNVTDVLMPHHKLREFSHQQFHMLYGVIRHVMPSMVYQHSQLEQQYQPTDDIDTDAINNGIKIMAIMGMMDTVLQETQLQIHETIDTLIDVDIQAAIQYNQQNNKKVKYNDIQLSLNQHIAGWHSTSRSDVLSTLSVAGVSSLINWASAVTTQQNSNTSNNDNTPINRAVSQQ